MMIARFKVRFNKDRQRYARYLTVFWFWPMHSPRKTAKNTVNRCGRPGESPGDSTNYLYRPISYENWRRD
jgi:hypothetical protein